jgi:tRNA nucleotidyltransferase (CCA-adding enzyme)
MELTKQVITPEAEQVLDVIRSVGGRPMLTGGCVRNAILYPHLRIPSGDVDVEVYGKVELDTIALALADRCVRADAVALSFGVLKVKIPGTDMDIALPRQERKTAPGHRGFSVLADPELSFAQACARRDYTVNSLMLDPQTRTVSDFHGGLDDLSAKVLRHTSDRFSEDPLRVLRGVRFAAVHGFTMAPATASLCQRLTSDYGTLSTGRIWEEWEKIGTRGVYIGNALQVLHQTWWECFYPFKTLHNLRQDPSWHPEGNVWTHTCLAGDQAARLADEAGLTGTGRLVVVFAALCHDLGKVTRTQYTGTKITSFGHAQAGMKPSRAFLESIGCPEAVIARILPLVREHMNCTGKPSAPVVHRLVRRLAPATLEELALVVSADRKGRGDRDAASPADSWLEAGRTLRVEQEPRKGLLTGHHLISTGMTPGPAFTPLLSRALLAQDNGEFEDEEGALAWLTRQV